VQFLCFGSPTNVPAAGFPQQAGNGSVLFIRGALLA